MSALQEANEAVNGPRRHDYGHPYENHGCTAALWREYLKRRFDMDIKISRRDVCILNILQKISRDGNMPSQDNLVDIAGWAENAHICEAGPPSYDEGEDGKIEE